MGALDFKVCKKKTFLWSRAESDQIEQKIDLLQEAAKKILFSGPATKRGGGGGGKGLATKKKELFWGSKNIPKKFPPKNVATKLEGGGVQTFFSLPFFPFLRLSWLRTVSVAYV